jgi:ABC-2 type transport system permease protein
MSALLRAELIKLTTTRTFAAMSAAAVGTSLVICILVSVLTEPTQESVLTDVFTADTSGLFIAVLAIVGITGEWRHRTITSSLLAAPDRLGFLAAKTLAFAIAGVALSVAISVAVALLGLALLSFRDLPLPELGALAGQIGRNAAVAGLVGAFGVSIGSLVRNQPTAIVGVLLFSFVIEPTVLALAPEVGRFGPFGALLGAVAGLPPEDVGAPEGMLLVPALAVMLMLAWIASFFVAGATLLRRRDLN